MNGTLVVVCTLYSFRSVLSRECKKHSRRCKCRDQLNDDKKAYAKRPINIRIGDRVNDRTARRLKKKNGRCERWMKQRGRKKREKKGGKRNERSMNLAIVCAARTCDRWIYHIDRRKRGTLKKSRLQGENNVEALSFVGCCRCTRIDEKRSRV